MANTRRQLRHHISVRQTSAIMQTMHCGELREFAKTQIGYRGLLMLGVEQPDLLS
jgi:hypothetical protein